MLTKRVKNNVVRPINLSELSFRKPYTEKWLCDGESTVFFSNVAKKSGVVVERYSLLGKKFIRLGCANTDMYSNALILQKYAQKIGAKDLEFAFIPCAPNNVQKVKNAVWLGYLNHQIYDAFDIILPWFEHPTKETFPQDKLTFYAPFFFSPEGERRWNFYDLKGRPGLYVIAEDGVIVRSGQARDLAQRPRAYFYPISKDKGRKGAHYKVSYHDRLNKHSYALAPIPFPLSSFRSWGELYKRLDFFEKKLNRVLAPRDNRKGVTLSCNSSDDLPF